MISMHSFNALQAGDVYGSQYGTQNFYESENAASQFDTRIRHVMNHVHHTLNQPWKELSDYIFAFEAQNEAMIGLVGPMMLLMSSRFDIKGFSSVIDKYYRLIDFFGEIINVILSCVYSNLI